MLRHLSFAIVLSASYVFEAIADEQSVHVFRQVEGSVVELRDPLGGGTGIVLNDKGLVLTNAHVVASPLRFRCIASLDVGGKRVTYVYNRVHVLGVHKTKDLAIVQLDLSENQGSVLPPVRLAGAAAQPGQQIYAIGNPGSGDLTLTKTITSGLLSGVDRRIEGVSYYQISAPINPGNSGGPLTDAQGSVLGLVTLRDIQAENVAFAIPLDGLDLAEFVPLSSAPPTKPRASRLIEMANELSRKYSEFEAKKATDLPAAQLCKWLATKAFLESLLEEPGNPTVYRALGIMMSKYKENGVADELFARTIEMMPWGPDAKHYRAFGVHLQQSKRRQDAEIVWREGVAKFPTLGRARFGKTWQSTIGTAAISPSAHCAAIAFYFGLNKAPGVRVDFVKALMAMARQKVAAGEKRDALEAILKKVPQELRQLAESAKTERKKGTLAITPAFQEYVKREKLDLTAGSREPAVAVKLTNALLPPRDGGPASGAAGFTDLLADLDVARNGIKGGWILEGGSLTSPNTEYARIQLPAEVPQEYDLALSVVRVSASGPLAVGFVREGTQSVFLIDFGARSGIYGRSATVYSGTVLPERQKTRLVFRVRRGGLTVSADGKQLVVDLSASFPATPAVWQVRDPFKLFLAPTAESFASR